MSLWDQGMALREISDHTPQIIRLREKDTEVTEFTAFFFFFLPIPPLTSSHLPHDPTHLTKLKAFKRGSGLFTWRGRAEAFTTFYYQVSFRFKPKSWQSSGMCPERFSSLTLSSLTATIKGKIIICVGFSLKYYECNTPSWSEIVIRNVLPTYRNIGEHIQFNSGQNI